MSQGSDKQRRDAAPGSVRELLAVAMPMMAATACDTFTTFIVRVFLARLGTPYMNGALAGGMATWFVMSFFGGLIGYSTALIGQYYGASRKDICAVAVTQAMIVAACAYPAVLLLAVLVRIGFAHSGIAPAQLGPQTVYFSFLTGGSIFVLLRGAFSGFFSGIGRTKTVMAATLATMIANVGLSYILIFGCFGLPALKIAGAGIAAVFASMLGVSIFAVSYFHPKRRDEYTIAKSFRFDRDVMLRLLRYGTPAGIESVLTFAGWAAILLLFQTRGQIAATSITIAANWDMVAYVPLVGIEIAVTSLVGRYKGAGQQEVAERTASSGIVVGLFYSLVLCVLFVGFPRLAVDIFRPDIHDAVFENARPLSQFMIRLMGIYVLSLSMICSYLGALRGAGDTAWALRINAGMHWLMAFLLAGLFYGLHASAAAAWWAVILWVISLALVLRGRFRGGHWRAIPAFTEPEASG